MKNIIKNHFLHHDYSQNRNSFFSDRADFELITKAEKKKKKHTKQCV